MQKFCIVPWFISFAKDEVSGPNLISGHIKKIEALASYSQIKLQTEVPVATSTKLEKVYLC